MKEINRSILEFTEYSQTSDMPTRIGDFKWINAHTSLEKINLNWNEKELPERLRTKHVHRLHPYLGKYIPQLVEIFLRKFNPRIVCDPFMGSGTTLVEANTLGISSVGCDVSAFNCLISKVKTDNYDILSLERELKNILINVSSNLEDGSSTMKLIENEQSEYLHTWFSEKTLGEILTYRSLIEDYTHQDVMKIILCRAARSVRLTSHFDLDFPKKPYVEKYYCHKHNRICKPTDNAMNFLKRYTLDTIERIKDFSYIRTKAPVKIICDDSRKVKFPEFDAVITSPPYVGLIDYHEQHRYAYELLKLPDKRLEEIGSASYGRSKKALVEYFINISKVFSNVKKNLSKNGVLIIVVNDKNNLYNDMAEKIGYLQHKTLERRVNRRTGRRSTGFSERIYIWKKE